MREILNIVGLLRNSLAHNQPIYNFNVKEYYSSKSNNIHYILPKAHNQQEQYVLTTNYMFEGDGTVQIKVYIDDTLKKKINMDLSKTTTLVIE